MVVFGYIFSYMLLEGLYALILPKEWLQLTNKIMHKNMSKVAAAAIIGGAYLFLVRQLDTTEIFSLAWLKGMITIPLFIFGILMLTKKSFRLLMLEDINKYKLGQIRTLGLYESGCGALGLVAWYYWP